MIPHVRDLDPSYGTAVQVSPLVQRLVAKNPGKFTYLGTGTYLVGTDRVAVIDPGPRDEAHLAALDAALDGRTLTHILITHTHRDHSPASRELQEAHGGVTYGFGPHPAIETEYRRQLAANTPPDTDTDTGAGAKGASASGDEEPGDTDFVPDVTVADGDVISGHGWTIEALHTPGHISNHLCFSLAEENSLFSGDHVMGWSTTVIPPPDGDMGAYYASLDKVLARSEERYYPTHGPPIEDPHTYVTALKAHRLEREAQVLAQLVDGPKSIPEIVKVLYAAVDEKLHEPAGRSVLAHLLHLEALGQVRSEGDPLAPSKDAITTTLWLRS